MRRENGTFFDYGNSMEFIAVSNAPKKVNLPAHVITDAISNGTLPVHEVSGCKCVTLADLLKIKNGGAK
ncbi:hypothetical protein [Marinobacter zhanjiangensis]|uniref:Uncharacterized protein n=1 Tax=Marinobacter zhanjiangensis TaxID=578215 RepID=A0ABQ3B6D6_9GAMM|nr:hypothetical protein [Marinobacter zhanjiangensis]GGY81998.1 hypothetical protein GCM10007071_31690 [Marinobacter zhanjiangensis]